MVHYWKPKYKGIYDIDTRLWGTVQFTNSIMLRQNARKHYIIETRNFAVLSHYDIYVYIYIYYTNTYISGQLIR